MKKVYYVVQLDYEDIFDIEELTGKKSIYLYTISNDTPNLLGVVETTLETETLNAIRTYIDKMGDKELSFEIIKFIEL